MKAEIYENEHCFFVSLTAENQEEAVRLVRMAMNRTVNLSFEVDTHRDGAVTADVWTRNSRRACGRVPRRK